MRKHQKRGQLRARRDSRRQESGCVSCDQRLRSSAVRRSERTLIVSSGWHTSASASPAPPPASKWMPIGVFFFGSALDAMVSLCCGGFVWESGSGDAGKSRARVKRTGVSGRGKRLGEERGGGERAEPRCAPAGVRVRVCVRECE